MSATLSVQPMWDLYLRRSFDSGPTSNAFSHLVRTTPSSQAARNPQLTSTHDEIDRLAKLPVGWDGHGSARPNEFALERGRQLIEDAYQNGAEIGWESPHVSASEDGDVVFEWWRGIRKLTVYVGPKETTYLKSWGPNIVDDMADGVLEGSWEAALWIWLLA